MEELKRQELLELKKFFVDDGWVDGLFQILFVIEGVKPGMFLKQNNKRKLKLLKNMLSWFDLFVSMRHGGYTTKNKDLYKKWNKLFGFKLDAEEFLGYPKCCISRVHGFGGSLTNYQLYSLFKAIRKDVQPVKDLREYLKNSRFLHHVSCSLDCIQSLELELKYEFVINKYTWLVGDLLKDYYSEHILGSIQLLESLKETTEERIKQDIEELAKSIRLVQLRMSSYDMAELYKKRDLASQYIDYGINLIKANYKCMFGDLRSSQKAGAQNANSYIELYNRYILQLKLNLSQVLQKKQWQELHYYRDHDFQSIGVDGKIYDSTDWMYGKEIWIHKMPEVDEETANFVIIGVKSMIDRAGLDFKIKYKGSLKYMSNLVKYCTRQDKLSIDKLSGVLVAHSSRNPTKGGSLHADIIISRQNFFEGGDGISSYLGGLAVIGLKNMEDMILSWRKDGIKFMGRSFLFECAARHETAHLLGYPLHHLDSRVEGYALLEHCAMNENLFEAGYKMCDKCIDALNFYWKGIEDRTGKKFFKKR